MSDFVISDPLSLSLKSMRPMIASLRALLTVLSAFAILMLLPGSADAQNASFAITNVTVLPMNEERVLENHTVIVRDGVIVQVAPSEQVTVPDDAVQLDGTGRYLMPGLAEMHGHIPGSGNPQYTEDVLFLYVSNGVTTVRGMLGDPSHLDLRDRASRGEIIAPTIFAAGPGLSGERVADAEAAERTVREQHAAGYDLLKVFNMSPRVYEHMAATAHELGMPFAGHVPESVGLQGAIDARQSSIDHFDRYVEYLAATHPDVDEHEPGFFGSGMIGLVDLDRIPAAVAATREARVWNVPTLSLVEHLASPEPAEQMIRWPEMRYMPQEVLDGWVRSKHSFGEREDFQPEAAAQLVDVRRQLTKALHDAGAMIALGSDAPQFFNVPGFSLHHEMEMMVNAGLTPHEVLITGTRNPAIYFGKSDEFGTVEVGQRADLVLLEANPLEDISNVQNRVGVMLRGKWLPETEIQERLEVIATRHGR